MGLIKRFPYKTRKLVGCQDLNGYFVPQKPSWASTSHRERSPSSKRHSCSCTVSPRTVQVRCSWASRPRWKPCSCCGGSCWSQSRRSLRGRVNRIRKCSSTARRHQLSWLFCIKWCISNCLWNFNCIKPLGCTRNFLQCCYSLRWRDLNRRLINRKIKITPPRFGNE